MACKIVCDRLCAIVRVFALIFQWYDANDNASRRLDGSQDATLTYDAENRLTAMSGGVASSYVYDADGNRVKETIGGVTRVFVGMVRSTPRSTGCPPKVFSTPTSLIMDPRACYICPLPSQSPHARHMLRR